MTLIDCTLVALILAGIATAYAIGRQRGYEACWRESLNDIAVQRRESD